MFNDKKITTRKYAKSMKMTVFWVVAPCSLVDVYRRFRGAKTQKAAIFILAAVKT
jgi:hypothetical protein